MKTTYKVYGKQGDENMRDFILSCCSTVDLTKEYLEKRDIHFISLHFEVDGKAYTDYFGESISADELYKAMLSGSETKTSQVNAIEFEEYFETFLKEGKDILHLSVSSGVSGTFNSANIAKMELEERYPERKIMIVDSLGGSSGSGMMIEKLADMRDEGKSIEELYIWIEEHKLNLQHWLFSTDLSFFVKGGRISKASGFVGNLLNICPLIDVSADGKLTPRRKIRTKKKVMEAIVAQMEALAYKGLEYSEKCFMCHSGCLEDAKKVASMIEERFHKLKGKVQIFSIGPAIGCHAGPGTVGVFFWGAKRV